MNGTVNTITSQVGTLTYTGTTIFLGCGGSCGGTPTQRLDGQMDEFLLYNKSLTHEEFETFASARFANATFGPELTMEIFSVELIAPPNGFGSGDSLVTLQCNCTGIDGDPCTQLNLTVDDVLENTTTGSGN